MSQQPERKGRIWRTDDDGRILNDAAPEHIKPPFDAVVRDVVAACSANIEADVHSIYITGSVARGLAVPGKSDVNVFAVLESEVDPELVKQDWVDEAEKRITAAHSCISDAELELWPYGYVFRDPDEFAVGAFIIKTHSVCVWGNDLSSQLPDYKVSAAIANDDIVQIKPDIEDTIEAIKADNSAENVRYLCRYICKNIIHAGFGLVMADVGVHTRDVDAACDYFKQRYSAQAEKMQRALDFVDSPTDNTDEVLAYLEGFGAWMIGAADGWLDTHNPERCLEMRTPDEL